MPPPSDSPGARLSAGFAVAEDALLVVLLALMIGLAGTQIVLRNVFDAAIGWGDPLLRVTVMWVGLLGAMVATREDNHIAIDLVTRYVSGRAGRASRAVAALFTSGVCALLAWHGARFVLLDWDAGTSAFAGVPAWACELIVPVGFGVMALRFLVTGASAAVSVARGER